MKHLTEPFSVAWSCFALPFETWKIQGLENAPRLVLLFFFFWYLQSPLRMTVLLFKLDQIEQKTSASCSFFFFYIFFLPLSTESLKALILAWDGRTDGGETEGTVRVPRGPKNESTLQKNFNEIGDTLCGFHQIRAWWMIHQHVKYFTVSLPALQVHLTPQPSSNKGAPCP